jgi:ApbE superfamily uncharacterized protein (UPF0280 family)
MYEERIYRDLMQDDILAQYQVQIETSDLWVMTNQDLHEIAFAKLEQLRNVLINYGESHNDFFSSLIPLHCEPKAHIMIREMHDAAKIVGVGPMASVAGAISTYVGRYLSEFSKEVIIENGGDLYINSEKDRIVAIQAGKSSLSEKIGIRIKHIDMPMGVCTSAGTVGHSLSFGKADAVVVVSKDVILADATATSIGNIVKTAKDIEKGLTIGKSIQNIIGIIIIVGDQIGICGEVDLVKC